MKEQLFFIAVLPDETIQQEVTDFKNYLAAHFGASHALKSPPHITLFPPFKWQSNRVDALAQALDDFAVEQDSFSLTLKNFSSFPPRVLFVDVAPSEYLRSLQQDLARYLEKELHLKNDRESHGFNAHMTIAHKDLKRELYSKAWVYFSKQTYERTFLVSAITLLEHKGGRWEVYEDFELGY